MSRLRWPLALSVTAILAVGIACANRGSRGAEGAASDSTAKAAAALPPPAGTMVTIPSGTDTIGAYLSLPEGGGKGAPAVVVVQEWWGLNDWVKSVADRFAHQGYVAIAPDLYRGQVATDPNLAHELMRGLPDERATADIRAGAAYLAGRTDLAPPRTAVIGFCMGGGLALQAALDGGPFAATVVCYGKPVTSVERLKTLGGPVLGIYGADDRGITPADAKAFETALKSAGKLASLHEYKGAGHAFLNSTGQAYAESQAKEAWHEIDEFLAKRLKAGGGGGKG